MEDKFFCKNCVLHSHIPGVEIDSNGICSFCSSYKENNAYEGRLRRVLTKKMELLFEKERSKANLYDAIVLFSGGKDSAYLLKMAKEKYNLRVLALTIQHPIVNEIAKKNVENTTRSLDVDHITFRIQKNIYINVIRKGILKGGKYGLDEFFGCTVCSFFHYWIPIQIAMRMNIPIILEGSDLGQSGVPLFGEGDAIKQEIMKGNKPYGRIHDLFNDVLGDDYKNSIYYYNHEDIVRYNYPSIISPFTFLDYDYKNSLNELESMGLQRKNFSKIYTNCSLIPFFSYFTIKQYDCIPYIKQYANEIRRNYPMLMQLSLDNSLSENVLNKETIENLISEYKNVVLYIVENKLTASQILNGKKDFLIKMAPTYLKLFKEQVAEELMNDLSRIPYYAEFFGIDIY